MLENYLTKDEAEFNLFRRSTSVPELEDGPMREAYRYSKVCASCCLYREVADADVCGCGRQSNKFVMRSQLDCVDRRLPGTGVFDIKTRAALPIRVDQFNYEVRAFKRFFYAR